MNIFKSTIIAAMFMPALTVAAQEPSITLRTNIYDVSGPNNACTLFVGGTAGTYVTVDCGFGAVEYEIKEASLNSSTQELDGTAISCQVSKEGLIKIYQDEDCELDYFNAEGCGLEWVDFADPSKIKIVNFCHNSLESLDLSNFTELQIAYLSDNPYSKSPLKIGKNHPELAMLEIQAVPNLDPEFDINTYPKLTILDMFAVPDLTKLTPSGCPGLVKLTIDCTNVSELDLSNNPGLAILNISDTAIREIDLSNCTNLQQLYVTHGSDTYNPNVKLKSLDVTNLPKLYYLFAAGNDLESIDVSKNSKLDHLWLGNNRLTNIDISNNPDIRSLRLEGNYFDFVTLPADRETFNEYEYAQNPFSVPAELEEGKTLDLSSRTNRPGTETYGRLVSVKREAPYTPIAVDESKYSFSDGKLTVHKAISDSVYLELVNSDFTAVSLSTTKFMVKKAADMGKPDTQMTFQPALSSGQQLLMSVGIEGATAESPKNLYVKQGDGSTQTFQITTSEMPDNPNVTLAAAGYGETNLSVDMSERISAIGIDGIGMYACDVTPMSSLRNLRMTGTGLYTLDLGYNRCLEKLIVTGNHFTKFSLDGVSGDYMKNMLTYVDISNNEITDLTLSFIDGIEYFDLHSNRFTELNFTDAERIRYLNVSDNQLEKLKLNYLSSLVELDASHNRLSEYIEPETNIMQKADFSDNCFTYASLPSRNGMSEANFTYAPQANILISKKAPGVDLGSQDIVIDGKPVEFAWYKSDGTQLVEGTQYTITDGRTRFIDTTVGAVHCVMTCEALPAFSGKNALMTTDVIASEMPTNVAAGFRTAEAGTMELSLASHENGTTIYIDWNGDGTDLEEYFLNSTYTLFSAQTKPDTDVKVYSYEADNGIKVFSIGGVKLESFDGTNLNRVEAFSLSDTGLETLNYPATDGIRELGLSGNMLTEFDATKFPRLYSLSLTGNKLRTLDLTPCPDIELLAAARNELTEVKFKPSNKVYFLDLTDNQLESYDLQQHPELNQLGLAGNKLTTLNPSNLPYLRTISIDNNKFTFETLPLPDDNWVRYTYANQAPVVPIVNGLEIDLSSQKEVNGTPTLYRWFIGVPNYNSETGELEGEELVVDEEYTVADGVTTLVKGYDNMLCVMTNSEFPNVTLTTDLLALSSLETIVVDDIDHEAKYYTLDGIMVTNPTNGLYIVVRGNHVTKELVK